MLLHPLMLAWIGGAVVPVVLHLLSRSRHRVVPWGAMMFLAGASGGAYRSARARQMILLLLRMCAIGLLTVALARPVIASRYSIVPTAGLTTGGPAAVVIIIDDSASMGYTKTGETRLDQARQVTLQILGSLKRGDQAALLVAGARDNQPASSLNADLQSIAARVADLEPDIGSADFALELDRALDLLVHNKSDDQEIYLISDTQALSWKNVTASFMQRLKARHSKHSLPRITVIPIGGNVSDNIAVDAIDVPDHLMIRDQSTTVTVRVHNYGSTSQPAIPLAVWTGARTLVQTIIAVPAHSIKSVSFPLRLGEAGSRVLSAAVTSTGLTSDDRLDSAVDVVDSIQVRMVSDAVENPTSRPATMPATQTSSGWRDREWAVVTTAPSNAWFRESLKYTDVLIFSNVPHFDPDQQRTLEQFISGGGGVMFLLGDHIDTDNYNKILYQNGAGIFPAMLHRIVSGTIRIANVSRQHPIFRSLPNHFDLMASQFFPVTSLISAAHVLGRLPSGDPWLIENSIGRGRVITMTAVVDSDVTNAFFQSVIRYLYGGKVADRNLWPGEPIIAEASDTVDDRSATVQFASGGPREPAATSPSKDHTQISYSKTNTLGTYRLRYRTNGKERVLNYVVAPHRSESDLTCLTDDQWKTLSDRVGFHRVDLSKTTVAQTMSIQRGGREIWIDLLGGVLILMTAEMLLSRHWSA